LIGRYLDNESSISIKKSIERYIIESNKNDNNNNKNNNNNTTNNNNNNNNTNNTNLFNTNTESNNNNKITSYVPNRAIEDACDSIWRGPGKLSWVTISLAIYIYI
jgi:hypothetical protein